MKKGFTLIELIVVLAIMSILTAIGVPVYQDFLISSKENVAKNNLKSIATKQAVYHHELNQYFPCPKKTLGTTQIEKQFFGDQGDQGDQGDLSSSDYSYKMTGGCSGFIASALIYNSKAKCFKIDQNISISTITCPTEVVAKGPIKEVDDWECVSSFGGPGTLINSPGNKLHGACIVVVAYSALGAHDRNYASMTLSDGTSTMFRIKPLYLYSKRQKSRNTISYQRNVAWLKYLKSKDGTPVVVMDQRNIFANPAPLYNAITNGGSLNKVDGFSDDGVSVNSGSPIGNDSYKSLKGTFSQYNNMSKEERKIQLCKARPADQHCP